MKRIDEKYGFEFKAFNCDFEHDLKEMILRAIIESNLVKEVIIKQIKATFKSMIS